MKSAAPGLRTALCALASAPAAHAHEHAHEHARVVWELFAALLTLYCPDECIELLSPEKYSAEHRTATSLVRREWF